VSLRTRLLLVLAALVAVGLVAADAATYAALRSSLIERADDTLEASAHVLQGSLEHRGLDPGALAGLASLTPGVFIELRDDSGEVLFSGSLSGPAGTTAVPRLPDPLPAGGPIVTVPAEEGATRFRLHVEPLPGGTLVVAAPLDDVEATLSRLLWIELLVSLAVVAAVIGLGLWLVRLGLRPLRRMEATAAAIAGGDLSQRVEDAPRKTEIGRLSLALNAMLARIEEAFAERTASEQRLRRFVADASHELRTPLSSVQAYAELFERGARDRPDDLARAMAGIEREARRMGILVDDLLLLARLDQGRPLQRKRVDLAAVAAEAIEAARLVEPARPLDLAAPGPVLVTGDPARLRQVVDNLLANVRAHTPPAARAEVRVASDDGKALLEVADEGPGLGEEQASHVFERFYRGDPSRSRDRGGSGLGLAIVAAIAEAHGGRASVASAASTFARATSTAYT